jgi:outer membrane cobalamin receptor
MAKRRLFIVYYSLFIVHCSLAQVDTTKVYHLEEVVKTASSPSSYQAGSPLQILKTDVPEKLNALSVSDAVKHFSGVQVKDYGGVGGLKTVSIRSLGANYTTVAYDGISVSDYQTGQIDLGRFSLDNVEMLTLNIGESNHIFQTAQAQSLAGVLNIITQSFVPETDKKRKIKTSLKGGSFGFINPALAYSETLHEIFTANVSADWLKTDGDYPFEQTIGNYNSQEKQHKKRENSDVETLKLEANLKGNFKNGGNLLFKNYFYTSDRGLPGAVIYYKDEPYYDRLKDHHFFSQLHYQPALREKFQFQTNAKFSISHTDYFNPTLPAEKQTSLYDQREFYLNATFLYQPSEKISFSWANDGAYSDFESNQNVIAPSRRSWLSALSGKYEIRQFNVTAKLLNTALHDQTPTQTTDYNHLSPYLGFSIQPFSTIPLRVRGFYKTTFRMPTFGDLYYSTTQSYLKPEKAQQYDLGLTMVKDFGQTVPYFSVNADFYWNKIRDKIVAVPTRSLFWWSMLNYGKVAINGIDLNTNVEIQVRALRATPLRINVSATYTCQNALNQSAGKPEIYNKRLIYTARHSASGNLTLKTPWMNVGYNIIYCGKRYNREDNAPTSQMSPFAEQGVNLMRTFAWQKTNITLSAECLNIGNVQYEVVNAYPMPARSFRFGIHINY